MLLSRLKVILIAASFLGLTGSAFAQISDLWRGNTSFGTKFCCCLAVSGSSAEGPVSGWQRTLADRALTQADAQLRCGFHKMFWGTHRCPQGSGGGGAAAPARIDVARATYFAYNGGDFYRATANSWVERKGGKHWATFRALGRDRDFIYLGDDNRRLVIALGRDMAFVRAAGADQFSRLFPGRLR